MEGDLQMENLLFFISKDTVHEENSCLYTKLK
jgi:hypothetical protein